MSNDQSDFDPARLRPAWTLDGETLKKGCTDDEGNLKKGMLDDAGNLKKSLKLAGDLRPSLLRLDAPPPAEEGSSSGDDPGSSSSSSSSSGDDPGSSSSSSSSSSSGDTSYLAYFHDDDSEVSYDNNSNDGLPTSWTRFEDAGSYDGHAHYIHADNEAGDASFATLELTGLDSGQYEIAITWVPYNNRMTDLPWEAYDGVTLRDSGTLNQQNTPTADYTDDGRPFEILATVTVNSGTLKVILSNYGIHTYPGSPRYAFCDGFRIEKT